MLYIKLAATGIEPAYVNDYLRTHTTFPDQKTNNQFFDEAQFKAYRMLGKCVVENLFSDELLGETDPKTLRAWFQSLANDLLPDNDAAF